MRNNRSDDPSENGIFVKVTTNNGQVISDNIKISSEIMPGLDTNLNDPVFDQGPDLTSLSNGNMLVSWAADDLFFTEMIH